APPARLDASRARARASGPGARAGAVGLHVAGRTAPEGAPGRRRSRGRCGRFGPRRRRGAGRARRRDRCGRAPAAGAPARGTPPAGGGRVPRRDPRRARHMPRRRLAAAPDRPDARALAHETLVRVETTDAWADVLLGRRLATTRLGAADRALVTRLVYGTLAW